MNWSEICRRKLDPFVVFDYPIPSHSLVLYRVAQKYYDDAIAAELRADFDRLVDIYCIA